MAEFRIKIAGQVAAVSSLFESTRDYCARYLTEETPEIFLTVSREEMAAEQALLEQEAREEGLRLRRFSDPFLERAVLQRKMADFLLDRDVLLFHGSALAVDGEGYLFTAEKCGTGKSTHTRLWRQVFGDRVVMVNDDKPFLRISGQGVFLCGAPWSGKHGLDTNITVPLKGLCILKRGPENRIRRITAEEAMPMLKKQAGQFSAAEAQKAGRLAEALAERTALWEMECTKDPEAARTAYNAMSAL